MTLEEFAQMQAKLQKTFEPYQGFLLNIQKLLVPIHNSLDTGVLMNSDQQIAALSSIAESLQTLVGATKMLESFVSTTSVNQGYMNYSKNFTAIAENILGMHQPIKINEEAIKAVMGIAAIPTYDGLMAGLNNLSASLSGLVNEMYEESEEKENSKLETDFASNEELQEAITEQKENPIGFQERVANWAESKKKKYFIAICILVFVWNNFIQPYFQEYIGVPITAWTVAHVKDLPEKAGKFVGDLKEDIEAIIVENVPYYYKVTFIDENGEMKEGYVSKRSVKVLKPVAGAEIETEKNEGEK